MLGGSFWGSSLFVASGIAAGMFFSFTALLEPETHKYDTPSCENGSHSGPVRHLVQLTKPRMNRKVYARLNYTRSGVEFLALNPKP